MTAKEIVLKALFRLSKEDILDIEEIIKGYREKINKSKRDTILKRWHPEQFEAMQYKVGE